MDSNTPNTDTLRTEKVRWDLARYFYAGIDDPQIDTDVEKLIAMEKDFHATHKGKLAETLGQAMRDYAEIYMLAEMLAFIGLQKSLNVSDAKVKAKEAEVDWVTSKSTGDYLEFFTLELIAMDEAVLVDWCAKDEFVAKHWSWIEHLRIYKPHVLSEPVERALTVRSAGDDLLSELHEELTADIEIEFQGEKKTFEEALDILTTSQDADVRAEIMKLVNCALSGYYAKVAAQTLWNVTESNAIEDEERKYPHPMAERAMSNRVSDAMVHAVHKAVQEVASPLAQRYYRLKAKHLGLERLRWSDRNAPMPFSDSTKIPFDEAAKIVLGAYQDFSPTLAERVRRMLEEERIDAYATKGKSDGAFCSWVVLPGGKPVSFTFLSYLGSGRDVMTLAHEVGHGGHGELAGETQGVLMCSPPTAYAETASIFGEMTTFNFLKKRLLEEGDKKSLLSLLMHKLDDSVNTVVRQIGFSNFERRLHGMDKTFTVWSKPKKLSVEEINNAWLQTIKQLYGEDGEVFTYENMEYLWSYISHFHAYSPFYVYGYALAELLVQSLYAVAPKLGDQFEPLYLELLRSGSTKNAVELLAPFGLDPTGEEFWVNGINISMGALLQEAEALSAEMGVTI